jgi:hypothetical protein
MSLGIPLDKMGKEVAQSCYLYAAKQADDFPSLAWSVHYQITPFGNLCR